MTIIIIIIIIFKPHDFAKQVFRLAVCNNFPSIISYTLLGQYPLLIIRSDPNLPSCLRCEQIALRLCPSRSRSLRVDIRDCWLFQDFLKLPNFLTFSSDFLDMFGNLTIAEVRNWGRRGFSVPGRRELIP